MVKKKCEEKDFPSDAIFSLSEEEPQQQQKRHTSDLQKDPGGTGEGKTELQPACRKMKLLLPRVNSYLVPVQFPLSRPVVFQPSAKTSLPVSLSMSESVQSSKQLHMAPKVLPTSVTPPLLLPEISIKEEAYCAEESSPFASHQSTKEDTSQINGRSLPAVLSIKKERGFFQSDEWATPFQPMLPVENQSVRSDEELSLFLPVPEKQKWQLAEFKQPSQATLDTKRHKVHEINQSRRKQHLVLPRWEEPILLLPSSSGSDSFTLEYHFPFGQENNRLGNVSHLNCSQAVCGPFKTPIKAMFCKQPASSTPYKMPTAATSLRATDPCELLPSAQEIRAPQDMSPKRSPPVQHVDLRPPMFDSPQPLLLSTDTNNVVSGPLISSPASSNESPPEFQASVLSENCSLQEVLDESLSKILLDVSFPGFDENDLETDLSWSQFVPDLK